MHVDLRQEAILRAGLGVPGEWRRLGRLADRARATCDELRRLGSPRRTIEGYEQWVAEPSAAAVAWGELAPEALEVLEERGPGYAVEVAELAEGFGFDESAELDSRVVAHMRAHGMDPGRYVEALHTVVAADEARALMIATQAPPRSGCPEAT